MYFSGTIRAFEKAWLRPIFRRFKSAGTTPAGAALARAGEWVSTAPRRSPGSRPRICMLSPGRHAATGIATFACAYMPSRDWHLDTYCPGGDGASSTLPLDGLGLAAPLDSYDAILLQMGNSDHHRETLDAWLRHIPATTRARRMVYLHDAQLIRLWASMGEGNPWGLSAFYRAYYPDRKFSLTDLFMPQGPESRVPRGIRPLLDQVRPDLLIVNSAHCAALVRADLQDWPGPMPEIRQLFHPIPDRSQGLPAAAPLGPGRRVGHFGTPGADKGFPVILEAVEALRAACPVALVLAGFQAGRFARRHGLDRLPWVEVHDSPSGPAFLEAMASVDAGIQLRHATQGESSGVVSQLLSLDKPVVVSRIGAFAELGEAVVAVDPRAKAAEVARALDMALTAPPLAAMRSLAARRSLPAFHRAFLQLLEGA